MLPHTCQEHSLTSIVNIVIGKDIATHDAERDKAVTFTMHVQK